MWNARRLRPIILKLVGIRDLKKLKKTKDQCDEFQSITLAVWVGH